MQLRPYQQAAKDEINALWASGTQNVLAVMPTGAGKTVLFSSILAETNGAAVAIAHRQELVGQMSLALARNEVRHRIIGPKSLARAIAAMHLDELGRNYVDPSARCAAAGVDTLIRLDPHDPWLPQVRRWILDEAHHLTQAPGKWGKAIEMFPNAQGLGVTATPNRADGKGLGRHASGYIDAMVLGPTMRELIDAGYLTDYIIYAPPTPGDLDLSSVAISAATGDYNADQLRAAVHKSAKLVGDVVEHYLRIAPGKLGVVFAVDIEEATKTADAFNAADVAAAVVSSKNSDQERRAILRRFHNRELTVLVNVDLFGEGFDLPAIEVVMMARPTHSYPLFAQQFGRALRLLDGKERAIIIDHVGNVLRHGLPDAKRTYSLDDRVRGSRNRSPDDVIPVRTCPNETGGPGGSPCGVVYERVYTCCPACGHIPLPTGRSGPEQVDGDLVLLDPATLAAMRGEIARVDGPAFAPQHLDPIAKRAVINRHLERQQSQGRLREAIAMWSGYQRHLGRSDQEAYRRFYFGFGIDVASAQALGVKEADALCQRVTDSLAVDNVVIRA